MLTEVEFETGRFAAVEGTEREIPGDLVLLAMGFTGAERPGLLDRPRAWSSTRAATSPATPATRRGPGVFVPGDMGRGQSLIVWAIAEGRSAAAPVDQYLAASTAAAPGRHPPDGAPARVGPRSVAPPVTAPGGAVRADE